MEREDPEPVSPRVGPSQAAVPCSLGPPPPCVLQMRPQKHKLKRLCQVETDGTSAPTAPRLPLGPPIWAVSAGQSHPDLGAERLQASSPPPRLGVWAGARPAHPSQGPPSAPGASGLRGARWERVPLPRRQQDVGWAGSLEPWLLTWVLLCDSGRVALPLWASLLQMDKILSEVPENCDSAHLPQERARPPWGCPSRCPLLLQVPGPRWAEGTGSLSRPLPLLDPQALPQICRHPHPVRCLQVTDE